MSYQIAAALIALVVAMALAVTAIERLPFGPLHRFRVRNHQRHLQRRLAAGTDRYFEELRALHAYDPAEAQPLPQPFWRTFAFNLLRCGALVALFAFTPHFWSL